MLFWIQIFPNKPYPETDLISSRFDLVENKEISFKESIIIFSTPRSGSTLLCELLYSSRICIPHEYFQQAQYRPILEKRWDIEAGNTYQLIQGLLKYRVLNTGILGINVHGSHLKSFSSALEYIDKNPLTIIFLERKNKLKQAYSYATAKTYGQWSSEYSANNNQKPISRRSIKECLYRIELQNHAIQSFLNKHKFLYQKIYYEDIAAGKLDSLKIGHTLHTLQPVSSSRINPQINVHNYEMWLSSQASIN